ncbi:methyltransferase [Schlesneria sp.]|uniref:methyltransferase n=1 Tax=Schlesneria sp. TaxID=2762018 RepID=UPI002EDFA1CA
MKQAVSPSLDPTSLFVHFRGSYGSELLTAAVAHFGLFERLAARPMNLNELKQELQLEQRPALVLLTALRAMQLLDVDRSGTFSLSALAENHLIPGKDHFVGDYIGLAAESPGVTEMVARLRTNRPAHAKSGDEGAAFIYRDGLESAMEQEASARRLTLALAGRAKNVAPVLAEKLNMTEGVLLDVGGGTGIYSIACLQKNPHLSAIVFDRPEVLKVAGEFAEQYGVSDRLQLIEGDMFADPFPAADVILLSNILHDWDEPECEQLVRKSAHSLARGGRLVIHDVFLNDELDGPLPIALYSAALFTLTEGRAYSAKEYRTWMQNAGLVTGEVVPTLIHCGLLSAEKT